MSSLFDNTLIDGASGNVGRFSQKGGLGDESYAENEDMDFDANSVATAAKTEDTYADIRASTCMKSRRPTNVKLEDFEIMM